MICPVCKTTKPFEEYKDDYGYVLLICSVCHVCLWPEELKAAQTPTEKQLPLMTTSKVGW